MIGVITAKFVVSRCAYRKLRRDFGFFCSVNHFGEGGVHANHNATCSPSLTENDSRLLKNSERKSRWWLVFCRGKEADVASFLQVAKIRNIRKICEADLISRLFPETGRSQSNEPWNTKQTKTDRNPPIKNHKPWPFELVQVNMCFLRGPLRWLTEQKNPKFLRSLQNAQGDTTNFAITWPVRTRCNFIVWYSFTLLYSSKRFREKGSSPWY